MPIRVTSYEQAVAINQLKFIADINDRDNRLGKFIKQRLTFLYYTECKTAYKKYIDIIKPKNAVIDSEKLSSKIPFSESMLLDRSKVLLLQRC